MIVTLVSCIPSKIKVSINIWTDWYMQSGFDAAFCCLHYFATSTQFARKNCKISKRLT